MQHPTPKQIKRVALKGIEITWADGTTQELTSEVLRRECPCAACREARGDSSHSAPLTGKKGALKILSSTIQEETSLTEIWGVGTYALGLRWADGHDTGIYTFSYLRGLS